MPNTKVRFWPGVTGGVVTALLLLAWVGLCAALQIGVAASGRIYGSFAAVPILLAWVFVSWEIVLFGAEVAFALQNCATYRMEGGAREANVQSRLLLALSIVTETARAMGGPGAGFEVAAFARQRRVPVRFLNEMVEQLVHAGILAEIGSQSGRYALLRNPAALRIQDVLDGVLRLGVPPEELGLRDLAPEIRDAVSGLAGTGEGAPRSATIQDLLRAGATRPTPPVM